MQLALVPIGMNIKCASFHLTDYCVLESPLFSTLIEPSQNEIMSSFSSASHVVVAPQRSCLCYSSDWPKEKLQPLGITPVAGLESAGSSLHLTGATRACIFNRSSLNVSSLLKFRVDSAYSESHHVVTMHPLTLQAP